MTNKASVRILRKNVLEVKNSLIESYLLFSVPDIAAVLDCSDRKVFDLVRDGKLEATGENPGRRGIRVTGKSLHDYIDSITIAPEFWQR